MKTYFPAVVHPLKGELDDLLDKLYYSNDLFSCLAHLKEGKYLHVSPSFHKLTSYPPQELERKGVNFFTELAHEDDILKVIEQQARAFQEVFKPGFDPALPNFTELKARLIQPDKTYITFIALVTTLDYFPDGTLRLAIVAGYVPGADEFLNKRRYEEATRILSKTKEHYRAVYPPSPIRAVLPGPLTEISNELHPRHILSPREKDVLKRIANGESTKQIAAGMNISENTVESHRKSMFLKFSVRNVAELVKVTSKLYWLE